MSTVKLLDAPRNSLVQLEDGIQLKFFHIDGIYSYCETLAGEPCHLSAWAPVEVLGPF